ELRPDPVRRRNEDRLLVAPRHLEEPAEGAQVRERFRGLRLLQEGLDAGESEVLGVDVNAAVAIGESTLFGQTESPLRAVRMSCAALGIVRRDGPSRARCARKPGMDSDCRPDADVSQARFAWPLHPGDREVRPDPPEELARLALRFLEEGEL